MFLIQLVARFRPALVILAYDFQEIQAWDHDLFSLENCEASPTYSAAIRGGSGTSPRTRGTEFLAETKNQFMRTPKTIQIMVIMSRDISYTIVSKQNMWTDVT